MDALVAVPDELFAGVLTCMFEVAPLWKWQPYTEVVKYYALDRLAIGRLQQLVRVLLRTWAALDRTSQLDVRPRFTLFCMVQPQGIRIQTALPPLPMNNPLRWYDVYLENMVPNILHRRVCPVHLVSYRMSGRLLDFQVTYETGTVRVVLAQPHKDFHDHNMVHQWKWALLQQGDGVVLYTS
jgi:hypothetical protein